MKNVADTVKQTSVADTVKQTINYFHEHFSEYLRHQCNNSKFIQPIEN